VGADLSKNQDMRRVEDTEETPWFTFVPRIVNVYDPDPGIESGSPIVEGRVFAANKDFIVSNASSLGASMSGHSKDPRTVFLFPIVLLTHHFLHRSENKIALLQCLIVLKDCFR
jgi:hypothetical protein